MISKPESFFVYIQCSPDLSDFILNITGSEDGPSPKTFLDDTDTET